VPNKQATALPTLSKQLLAYISAHFRDAHPDAFKGDVDQLVAMRRQWVEPSIEAHPEIARGLTKWVYSGTPLTKDITRSLRSSPPSSPRM
jgi:programmed cell death 6-interacting protein